MDTICQCVAAIVTNSPAEQFPRFFKFAVDKFNRYYHAGCEDDEEVDHTLIWYISFASNVIRGATGETLLAHRTQIDDFIARIRPFKSTTVFKVNI
jgi:hypothetical protein